MNCRISHDLLQQRLDGTPIESPEWLEHLRGCTDCRALETAARRLQNGLRLLATTSPPNDLAARIAGRLILDRRRGRVRARRRWAVTLALAASLFVALVLRLDWTAPLAKTETPGPMTKAGPEMKETPSPTLRESVSEAGNAVASLTSQTADETVGPTRWLMPNVSRPDLPKVDLETIEPRPLREAGASVSAGLEPVTNSARRAVGLFLRELPPMDAGQKQF